MNLSLSKLPSYNMRGCPSSTLTNLALPKFPTFFNSSFTVPTPAIAPAPVFRSQTIHYRIKPSSVVLCSTQYNADSSGITQQAEADENRFQVLAAMKSDYNDIVILDTPTFRVLLLDSTQNVHSIVYKEQKWTDSYWDEFASLPAIVPEGPITIFGLGGGTAAHLILDLWPSLQLEGWEIDQILIDKARDFLGLSNLENPTQDGGILNICIGDALKLSANNPRKYAGVIVDLFSGGKVLPQLQEVSTWVELQNLLLPNGRFMVNCGGVDGQSDAQNAADLPPGSLSIDSTWMENPTIKALCKAYPGEISWKKLPKENGENYMALTGQLPDLDIWSANVPSPLSTNVKQWRPCEPS